MVVVLELISPLPEKITLLLFTPQKSKLFYAANLQKRAQRNRSTAGLTPEEKEA
jgi:hypothetical protein